jgi:transcriptional regulator with XRE-family HTH domain
MKDDVRESLREELSTSGPEVRAHYADMLLDSMVALQIKTLRQQRPWTQKELAGRAGMKQSRISAMERTDYSSWSIRTLKRLAKAFDLRLRVTFESFGSLLDDYTQLGRAKLERPSFPDDPAFLAGVAPKLETRTDNVVAIFDTKRPFKVAAQGGALDQGLADG